MIPVFVDPSSKTHRQEINDALEGPYFVFENETCSYCGSNRGVTVKNARQECVFEICGCCGFEKDYEEKGLLN